MCAAGIARMGECDVVKRHWQVGISKQVWGSTSALRINSVETRKPVAFMLFLPAAHVISYAQVNEHSFPVCCLNCAVACFFVLRL
jgi:hypothetical protein